MANRPSQPIPPTQGINYSPEAMRAAESVLDKQTRNILAAERARMSQETAAGAYVLGQALGLSQETIETLQRASVSRASELSPHYHEGFNEHLGSAAAYLSGKVACSDFEISAVPPTHASNNRHKSTLLTNSGTSIHVVSVGQNGNAPDEVASETADEKSELTYDPKDIITLLPDERLYDQLQIHARMRRFLHMVLPAQDDEIFYFSPRAASLLTYEVLRYYREKMVIPKHTPDRKRVLSERVSLYVGLYGPVPDLDEFASLIGVNSNEHFFKMQKRIAEVMRPYLPGTELLRRAVTTDKYGHPELIFSDEPISFKPGKTLSG